MDKKQAKIGLAIGGVVVLGFVAYTMRKKSSTAASNTGGTIASGYNPNSGVSISNVGGSNGSNGTLIGNNIGNTYGGDTPIKFNSANGSIVNAITGQNVSPNSWQGTTNKSGSLTYLNGVLGGEGSSTLALQGVTY